MSSSASAGLKELTKAINTFLGNPSLPLPEAFLDVIHRYLSRRDEYDDAAADQLQDSLLSIFDKRVKGDAKATGSWIAILRKLLPVLQTLDRVLPWFDACKGILDRHDLDSIIVDEAVAALMDLLTVIDEQQLENIEDSAANRIIDRLLELWVNRFYAGLLDGSTTSEFNEKLVRQVICNFGKTRPKDLFAILDGYFVRKSDRKSTIRFLCEFIQGQPPRLHQVLHTPLFGNLVRCLQHDTSTTVLSAALTTLVMLLPHMPSSLVPHLPALFNIYGRLLFWDRDSSKSEEHLNDANAYVEADANWDVALFETDVDDHTIAHLSDYYTILYGLYPINFMDYIRKPQRYMRHAKAAYGDELEAQPSEMRDRSETFRRNHVLHPNFYTLTIDSEKTDFGRWIKSEAADVVAECMSLCLETDVGTSVPMRLPAAAKPEVSHDPKSRIDIFGETTKNPGALLRRGSDSSTVDSIPSVRAHAAAKRRSSQSSLKSGRILSGDDSFSTPGIENSGAVVSPTHPQLQGLIQSNKEIKSGLHQSLGNGSTSSLSIGHAQSVSEKVDGPISRTLPLPPSASSTVNAPDTSMQVAHLQKQVLLLQNDLSFERYLKQQHMSHIGYLRGKHTSEAASEAETQNLLNMNRNLKSRFEDAKKSEIQARKESEKSRAMAKKWEADLANKLKALRDDFKKTQSDMDVLQKELFESKQECDKLRKLLCAAEVKELNLEQNMRWIEIESSQVESLKMEVQRLTRSDRDHQAKELERQKAVDSATVAEQQVEVFRMKLEAMETDVGRTKRLLQSQVKNLQAQLSEAQEERERPGVNVSIAVESALAASRAKQAEMQKQCSLLMRKYTALQSSLLDMQSEQAAQAHQCKPAGMRQRQQAAEANLHSLTESLAIESQPHQTMSDVEAVTQNITVAGVSPAVAPVSASSSGMASRVGSAHLSGPGTGSRSGPGSPDPRHLGGFQRSRKESRDKSKEEGRHGPGKPKKEKKPSGLRGIRGFV